jgi:cellulose synthase/poly-beta-1,6-N-acetylglucosamine synthase-like glycosyltransferase/phosphoglycerol transferase MdoB-like AlkP superfamily enzyme
MLFYIFIGAYSIGEIKKYLHKNNFTDYRLLASSEHSPSVSIIAPAYNEGATIIENVRSLLSIYYSNLEVIIVNDGSKDDSLQKLIDAYQLEKIDFFLRYQIKTKKARGVYRSKNPAFKKLIVVDKENGGKADALNTGVNIAANNYIICIDVDCVLEQDAVLKLVKPFLEQTKEKIIAVGGVIRIANSCEVKDGKLVKVHLPKAYLPRMQALEYIRAFLLARMAWSRLNGLLTISGAFGAFDKEIVIKAGGYSPCTVGEDMELVVRMRRYMEEQKQIYKVAFIPDPLCWTEAPPSFLIFGRQRNRWMRGTIETLRTHKKLFFNPRYGLLGMMSYPYWFFFEMLAPLIEFFGFIAFVVLAILGKVVWPFFFALLFFTISFSFLYSSFAIFMEVATYHPYKKRSEIVKLILTSFTEPFIFHPFIVWSSIKGFIDLLLRKRNWGEMPRAGFGNITTLKSKTNNIKQSGNRVAEKIRVATGSFIPRFGLLLGFFLLLKIFEITYDAWLHGFTKDFFDLLLIGFLKDTSFLLTIAVWFYLFYILVYLINKKLVSISFIVVTIFLCIVQFGLIQYFLTTLVPLGSDIWGYSWADIKQTVGASGGIKLFQILGFIIVSGLVVWAFAKLPRRVNISFHYSLLLFALFITFEKLNIAKAASQWKIDSEYSNNLSADKSYFFYSESFKHFFPAHNDLGFYADSTMNKNITNNTVKYGDENNFSAAKTFTYVDPVRYPFLHKDETPDVLSPFFNLSETKPNIVIIVVEGLGRAFTNEGAYLGNFTPFLDSFSKQSLYWENFLSEGGRTFAVLPSLLGSLPFYKKGFAELEHDMPRHLSLLNLLEHNGYHSSFYYGGDSRFDNMDVFLRKNNIGRLYDEKTFPAGYVKMPSSSAGFSWGYGDKELVRRYFDIKHKEAVAPFVDVLLTVSTHSPFIVNDETKYLERFERRLNELGFDEARKEKARAYKNQFASILFTDDALRDFFVRYAKRSDFKNTIFIVTGDHRMPEIPMKTKIDRYHVPLIIYSPLLKRPAQFESISTHFDITPSVITMLRKSYHIETPSLVSWLGSGLDTSRAFRNIHAYPFMPTKTEIIDFIAENKMINGDDFFTINSTMDLELENNPVMANKIKESFERFKQRNQQVINGAKLIPDSIYTRYAH